MTEEYKEILLKYLTGHLSKQTGYNIPQFEPSQKSTSNLYNYLLTNAGSDFKIINILQSVNSNNYVLYGNDTNDKGFIVIIDETLNPIQYINSFSSGTRFGEFIILETDENGRFYGIDKTTQLRFIMLNNITIKSPLQENYIVKLKISYNIPEPLSSANDIYGIVKAVGQAKYLIGGTISGSPIFTELTINVGAANDWVNYETTLLETFKGQSLWADWDDDELDFKASGVYYSANGYVSYWEARKNNDEISLSTILIDEYIESKTR